jgi:ribosomal protein S18
MESKKSCYYCTNKKDVDFKEVEQLQRYISFDNKIEARGRTKLCAIHQRKASKAIKTARQFGLIK